LLKKQTKNKKMGNILKELVKKHGFGLVMAAVTMDSYRRTVKNDNNDKKLEQIRAEAAAAKEEAKQADREEYLKNIAESNEKAQNCAVLGRHKEAADEHYTASDAYAKNPSEDRKQEVDRAKTKLDQSYEEVKDLNQSSFFEYFESFYNNYCQYIDSLTPDKIVCIFNIIMGYLSFSSFLSVLSILLSEKLIKRIKFLDRYPRILAILKLRTEINKRIALLYLFLHFFLMIVTILGNTYMLYL
jgi:hypothetical protein